LTSKEGGGGAHGDVQDLARLGGEPDEVVDEAREDEVEV
jgi:hypothetical protein